MDDADWRQLHEICLAVVEDLPGLAAIITDRIRAENPVYATLPWEEHVRFIYEQAEELLAGLAEHRLPTREQAAARELGSRRARQGLPVEVLLSSYHIGYQEVWNALLVKAGADEEELPPGLVRLVTLMWSWLRLSSGAAADAHQETLSSQQAMQINLTHRFLRILRGGDTHSEEATHLARILSFDPDGTFQAFCVPSASLPEQDLVHLQQRLARHRGTVQSANQGTATIIVCQNVASDAITDTIHESHPDLPVGVGLRRLSLTGAAASIVDAERTSALAAQTGGVVDFQNEWLFATLLTHRRELAPLFQTDQSVTGLPEHLGAAVRAYADHGFSVTAAARALHIHPNTVTYRLDRWHQLTGWTPRTLDGLMKSLLSLSLFPTPEDPSATHVPE
ncbi:helix-turn-helix domain-containing protein [Actinoallomurus bryophytorum]